MSDGDPTGEEGTRVPRPSLQARRTSAAAALDAMVAEAEELGLYDQ
jgi:hypothetical protein